MVQIKKLFSITDYKPISLEEIKQKNLYLGISINNKYFTKEHIEKYLKYMLKTTDNNICVLIVDQIQSINNEILNRKSKESSIKKANKDGNRVNNHCKDIIEKLTEKEKARITVIKWTNINNTDSYLKNLEIINNEFKINPNFKEKIMGIVKNNLGEITNRLNKEDIEYLSNYILSEIPIMLNGFTYNDNFYSVSFYPGNFKDIFDAVYNFKDLTSKLNLNKKTYFISAFAD